MEHDRTVPATPLRLRAAEERDAQRWWELVRDPDQRALGTPAFVPVPQTPASLRDRIHDDAVAWADGDPATAVVVAADRPERLLGTVSWRLELAAPMRVAELGYAVHPDARGRGVASTSLALLVRRLTADPAGPGLARLQLDHSVENPASCRVALRAGLPREGVRVGLLPLRGPDGVVRRHDGCLHGRAYES